MFAFVFMLVECLEVWCPPSFGTSASHPVCIFCSSKQFQPSSVQGYQTLSLNKPRIAPFKQVQIFYCDIRFSR